jgi:hypothetical protein
MIVRGPLADREALSAWLSGRSPRTIRARCRPVACDLATRRVLYDVDAVQQIMAKCRRVAFDHCQTRAIPSLA